MDLTSEHPFRTSFGIPLHGKFVKQGYERVENGVFISSYSLTGTYSYDREPDRIFEEETRLDRRIDLSSGVLLEMYSFNSLYENQGKMWIDDEFLIRYAGYKVNDNVLKSLNLRFSTWFSPLVGVYLIRMIAKPFTKKSIYPNDAPGDNSV